MRSTLLALVLCLPAAAQASPLESAWTESQNSFSASVPAARAVMASSQDEAFRDRLYLQASDAQNLDKRFSDESAKVRSVSTILDVIAKGPDGSKDVQSLLASFQDSFVGLVIPTAALKASVEGAAEKRPGTAAAPGARALRNAVLRLRATAEGLHDQAEKLLGKVKESADKLAPEAVPAAEKLAGQANALTIVLDDVVAAVEKLVKKG